MGLKVLCYYTLLVLLSTDSTVNTLPQVLNLVQRHSDNHVDSSVLGCRLLCLVSLLS